MAAPKSVEAYLAALPERERTALERLRGQIHAAAPGAVDVISYQMPAVRVNGRVAVCYAAFTDHCSLFPMSKAVIAAHAEELAPFVSGKGTLRFTTERPIPATVVRRVIKARVAELAARPRH